MRERGRHQKVKITSKPPESCLLEVPLLNGWHGGSGEAVEPVVAEFRPDGHVGVRLVVEAAGHGEVVAAAAGRDAGALRVLEPLEPAAERPAVVDLVDQVVVDLVPLVVDAVRGFTL